MITVAFGIALSLTVDFFVGRGIYRMIWRRGYRAGQAAK